MGREGPERSLRGQIQRVRVPAEVGAVRDPGGDLRALPGDAARHNPRRHARQSPERRRHPDGGAQLGHPEGLHQRAGVRAAGLQEVLRNAVPEGGQGDLSVYEGRRAAALNSAPPSTCPVAV